ncbi:helix-turn-helix domain-containing protein [Defluviimonas denitrificans]|uniref:HGGxSTG domain-containing protein n=1 Tax=Albidovulum denitrificans TaxID=404881 RepID=UPI0011B04C57
MTGDDIRTARIGRGWSQRELARRSSLTHRAVQYWEARSQLDPAAFAVLKIAQAFKWRIFRTRKSGARHGVLDLREDFSDVCSRGNQGERRSKFTCTTKTRPLRINMSNPPCGAKTRAGTPCRAQSEPGRSRCRLHGGKSTGPKTEAGRVRIASAQRRRWARKLGVLEG